MIVITIMKLNVAPNKLYSPRNASHRSNAGKDGCGKIVDTVVVLMILIAVEDLVTVEGLVECIGLRVDDLSEVVVISNKIGAAVDMNNACMQ